MSPTTTVNRSGRRWRRPEGEIRRLLTVLPALAMVLTGCLPDLPEPLSCPPASQVTMGDCTAALVDAPLGCFERERMECLTGPRATCNCVANECPGEGACYSDGQCPASVTQNQQEAVCLPVKEEEIGTGDFPSVLNCVCGCYGCAAACDGFGPVIGASVPKGQGGPGVYIALSDMPDSGRLGVYLRLRGFGSVFVVPLLGTILEPSVAGPYYFFSPPLSNDFGNDVLFDNGVVVGGQTDGRAYRWESAANKPTLLLVAPTLDPEAEVVSLFEMDCVVPFVMPLEGE